jgi:hypothetical protein
MGTPLRPLPVKLIIGFIYQDPTIFEKTKKILVRAYGPADHESPLFDFDKTNYYQKEMGTDLKRRFLSFSRLIPAEKLVKIKISTNACEKKMASRSGERTVNIDPGYITLSKLVLATTKSFTHRLYIGNGIYEEATLFFKDKSFQPSRWTYPDFRQENHIAVFNAIRDLYLNQLTKTYGTAQLYRCV